MRLEEQINEGIKNAMKAQDKPRLAALRNVKKYIIEAKTAGTEITELPDADVIRIIQKLCKQGQDSASIYKDQGRDDLYTEEMSQVNVLKEFLPKPMSDEELTEAIRQIIARTGASSIKEMGKVMGVATKELAGKADGKEISNKVKTLLS